MKMEVLRRSSVFAAEVMEVFDRTPTDKELVSQAKVLCRDYIHSRLIRAGIGWNKPEHSAPVPGGKLAEVSNILLRLEGLNKRLGNALQISSEWFYFSKTAQLVNSYTVKYKNNI
ncbi:Bcl-2-related ovarian killer protein [Varanus komodoensis]|nr:Bcl-2-related ovarian killer protein [Varanus komodoensis]